MRNDCPPDLVEELKRADESVRAANAERERVLAAIAEANRTKASAAKALQTAGCPTTMQARFLKAPDKVMSAAEQRRKGGHLRKLMERHGTDERTSARTVTRKTVVEEIYENRPSLIDGLLGSRR